jgi:conjugal transfer pilin signal peptidase TrbI
VLIKMQRQLQSYLESNSFYFIFYDFMNWASYMVIAFFVAIFLLNRFSMSYMVGINTSESLHGSLFLIAKKQVPGKGELAAFQPPDNRFYKEVNFIKYVKGVAGDIITKKGQTIYINGEYLAKGKKISQEGIPLNLSAAGKIEKGQYFMWAPHKDSYDSRYEDIGWIDADRIIGRAYKIF